MAATPPPGYTPPPADLPQRGDRATFSNRVDAWVTWFSTVILTQLAAIVANAYANAVDAAASATAALGYRNTALTYRDAAQAARDLSQGYRDTALTYRNQAEGFAAAALTSANNAGTTISATSTSSVAIGAGNKTFVVGTGKQFPVGVPVIAVNPAAPDNYVTGPVVSYTGGNLVIGATDFGGTGTFASWNIAIAGVRGPVGGTAGGTLTGAINEKKGTDVTSAAMIDPWATGGNLMALLGNATITALANAPQAGARRTLIVKGTPTITSNANIIVKGGTATLLAGDEIDIEAETTTTFLVDVRRGAGLLASVFTHQRLMKSSGMFVPKVTAVHKVTLFPVCGSGGAVGNTQGSCATGGGSGGICIGLRMLVAGTGYMVNLGSGAAAITYNGSPVNGSAGGASTFAVSGYPTMTANSGQGGNAALVGPLLGGLPGTATGGDINITGARGGNITGSTATGLYATGGAAVGLQGASYSGGDIVTGGSVATASGGAAAGGKGGDAAQGGRGGGAGAGGPGGDALAGDNGVAGVNLDGEINNGTTAVPTVSTYAQGFLNVTGAGAPGVPGGTSVIPPALGGASAGCIDIAPPSKGFSGMGGSAGFALGTARQPQPVGGASGGYAGANASGIATGGATATGAALFEWN